MALPVILVNSATGSDTQASGAGPSTALFGTIDASFVGAVVTLTALTDLTNVAVDGSHVLYLLTSTGVRFFKITAKADSGGATPNVTVTPSPAGTATLRTWAIGGKLASVGSASSVLLFDNAAAAGDAMPGWTVEMESGHTETKAAELRPRRAGDITDGPITLRGTAGAATLPIITFSNNGNGIVPAALYQQFRDFELRNTNATKTASTGIVGATTGNVGIIGVKIDHATNFFWKGITPGAINKSFIVDCAVGYTASDGITLAGASVSVVGNYIHDAGGHGLIHAGDVISSLILGNLIYDCTGDGIRIDSSSLTDLRGYFIGQNTIDDCGGDGIEILDTNGNFHGGFSIFNNILSNNGGYGLNYSGASVTAASLAAYGHLVFNNNTFDNTSGACNLSGVLVNDPGLDPQLTDPANGDFRIGVNLKAQGWPESNVGRSSTRSYVDIGAAQREEAAAGGGMLRHPGMSGGIHA